ncbi:ATPase domain-containing protein [Oleiagrimonas soli]|uniref:non-specific serine/threonine protein kinase n=1 Tax=Oleiagrimonas soli TaxID=1543381 RepID=A0A841KIH6_9GAMM|nr:ATPase domain-containing protein [Oleiagrimonas soli]MBB6184962.1 circadian clock protein KaiC [Oleiagrimonas soli]
MTTKVTINRLATGVPGLDEVLGGGLPEFSFNLIAGPPGCGKTTLAHQMMFALATPKRPALYFTVLGEPPLKMLRYQQQFDFFDSALVNRSIHFINLSDDASDGNLDQVLQRIVAEVEAHHPALVFVDSFRSVVHASRGLGDPHNNLQQFVQQLGMLMTSWQATTFLVGEYFIERDTEAEANPVLTVADGLIWLRQSVERNSMVRKMEIMKMRGQPTLPGLHTFRIGSAGLEVFAPAGAALPERDASNAKSLGARLLMGVPFLDEMMGGGLPRGYSVLVAGPSGSGKSILASAFLAEGARCNETGVIAVFEQRPSRLRNGLLAALIESGQVGLVDSRAPDLSIDEIVQLLLNEIRRLEASRVVIDSLSAFELALAPTFREDFRESLMRLVNALVGEGVTVLMTSELEDRYIDLRFSPYGTAFLTDAIILQRYIEVGSRIRRVLAVVKVRASAHSDELREFSIDDEGIHIGEMLSDQEGLLGGRPTRKQASSRSRTAIVADGGDESSHHEQDL